MPWRLLTFLLLALFCTALSMWMSTRSWSWVRTLDGVVLDRYFTARGAIEPREILKLPLTRDIVLVETRHALPRALMAKLLDQLRGAKIVAFDMMFVDHEAQLAHDELLPAEKQAWYGSDISAWRRDNAILATAIRRHGRVALGIWPEESLENNSLAPISTSTDATSSAATSHSATSSTRSAVSNDGKRRVTWRKPPAELWNAAKYHAHLLVEPDAQDSVCRAVRLRDGEPVLPALGVVLAAASLDVSPRELTTRIQRMNAVGGSLQLGNKRVNYGENGAMTIGYLGDRATFERANRVVYQRVLDGTYLPEDFRGKTVIIGEASTTSKEILPTPFGPMPGMQIHANVAATLLSQSGAPQPLSAWLLGLISFASCLLLILPLGRFPLWTSFALALLGVVALFLCGAWFFMARNLILPLSAPLLAMFLMLNALALAEYARARSTLGTFIGHEMVPQTMGILTRLRLGGHTEEATAWFCDLRGFSAISEGRAPEDVSDFLQRYTELLVSVVQRHGGRPIDYQGDGVFVLFEKRVAGKDFARRAVDAAIEMRDLMNDLRATLNDEGLTTSEVSFGIATGPMMIGVVGARHHMKMGAVGDTVNIASRVQNLSSRCGQTILLTKSTWEKVSAHFETEFCGIYPVRGRVEPLPIYAVLKTLEADCQAPRA